ncbi:MAG: SDR family NAD(P)-dependent oxidoreductase, partial [Pseudomonadota bacterium]
MTTWLKPGNNAVITGGANGIGYEAAKRYLSNGMNVLIADINEEALEKALDSLQAETDSGQVLGGICDVSEYEQVERLRDLALENFGKVHCLMNNAGAGIPIGAPWEQIDQWKKQIDINMWGIIHGCHAFIPSMLESGVDAAVI